MVEKAHKSEQGSHNPCQNEQKMNISHEAREMLSVIAGPRAWSDTRERWIERGARICGFPYPRARSIYYMRAKVTAAEWVTLQRFAALKNAEKQYGELHAQLRKDYQNVGAKLPPDGGSGGQPVRGAAAAGGEVPTDAE